MACTPLPPLPLFQNGRRSKILEKKRVGEGQKILMLEVEGFWYVKGHYDMP